MSVESHVAGGDVGISPEIRRPVSTRENSFPYSETSEVDKWEYQKEQELGVKSLSPRLSDGSDGGHGQEEKGVGSEKDLEACRVNATTPGEDEAEETYPEGGWVAWKVVLGAICANAGCFGVMNTCEYRK